MQRIFAIATLTWKAAFRFRLFWVLAGLLLGSVVVLPLLLKHDGTARGFTQILLTYTLSVITTLLGLATLWLGCGTLARDIEDCQMQVVAVKPIARWQIWLGKWLGLLMLNAALLAVSGAAVYGLLQWRAQRLPADQQRVLRNEIFVARAALKEPLPDLDAAVERFFQQRVKEHPVPPEEYAGVRNHIREQLKAGIQVVPSGYARTWVMNLGARRFSLRDQPLYVRAKFHAAQTNLTGAYLGTWKVGPPGAPQAAVRTMRLPSDTFHEFEVPPNLFDDEGKLTIEFINREPTALLFPLEDGFEVLYREGGFGLNFARGLLIILCWLALLAALALAAASLLSFPVAAFFSVSLLLVSLSTGTLSSVVSEGTVMGVDHEGGAGVSSWIDVVILPLFKTILAVANLVQGFSPVDALSTGRSITWGQLGLAVTQIVLLLAGLISLAGIAIFTRRELATAQNTG